MEVGIRALLDGQDAHPPTKRLICPLRPGTEDLSR